MSVLSSFHTARRDGKETGWDGTGIRGNGTRHERDSKRRDWTGIRGNGTRRERDSKRRDGMGIRRNGTRRERDSKSRDGTGRELEETGRDGNEPEGRRDGTGRERDMRRDGNYRERDETGTRLKADGPGRRVSSSTSPVAFGNVE